MLQRYIDKPYNHKKRRYKNEENICLNTIAIIAISFSACQKKEKKNVKNTTTEIEEKEEKIVVEEKSRAKSTSTKKETTTKKITKPKGKDKSNKNDNNIKDREFDIEIDDEFVDLGTYCASCNSKYIDGRCPKCNP